MPEALTDNVTLAPALTVWDAIGCVMIAGAIAVGSMGKGAVKIESTAPPLVTEPAEFVATTV